MSLDKASSPQRRRFSRVGFKEPAMLELAGQTRPCTINDISLKGALVAVPENNAGLASGDECTLALNLGSDERIVMKARLAHIEEGLLGLHCTEIDLDSVTNLRRLVELNLTDPDTLERDLEALLKSAQGD